MPTEQIRATNSNAEHIRTGAAALRACSDPDRADGAINAIAHLVADACLGGDGASMDTALSVLRVAAGDWEDRGSGSERAYESEWAEQRGRLYGMVDLLQWLVSGRAAVASAGSVEPGSHAHRMLAAIGDASAGHLNSGALAKRLGVDKTQISRTGRELLEHGLVFTTSLGRMTYWDLTPRGRFALNELGTEVDGGAADVPVAYVLEGADVGEAAEVARTLAECHHGVTAYVLSPHEDNKRAAKRARRLPPVLLVDAPQGRRALLAATGAELHGHFGVDVQPLEVARTSTCAFTVGAVASTAPKRRGRRAATAMYE